MTEQPVKIVPSITAVCRRCHQAVALHDPTGYIAGRSYGFSHCGLVQTTRAPQG